MAGWVEELIENFLPHWPLRFSHALLLAAFVSIARAPPPNPPTVGSVGSDRPAVNGNCEFVADSTARR